MNFSVEKKKIVVSGGTGFIGSWVVEKLLKRGACVRVIAKTSESLERLEYVKNKNKIEILVGDLKDPNFSKKAVDGCDAAFHLAALKKNAKFYSQHPGLVLLENVQITASFFEAIHVANIKKVVFISSSRTGHDWLNSSHFGYAWSKKIGEIFAEAYKREYLLETVVARVENTFGPRDNFNIDSAQVIPAFIQRIISDKENPLQIIGNPDEKRSFCYVEDVANALISLLENGETGVINISPSYNVSFREIINSIMIQSKINLSVEFLKNNFHKEKDDIKTNIFQIKPLFTLDEAIKATVDWYKSKRI